MSSSSPNDWHFGRLRGLRGARRVWSSDEEEETNPPSARSLNASATSPPMKKAGTLIKTEIAARNTSEVRATPAYASAIPPQTIAPQTITPQTLIPSSSQRRVLSRGSPEKDAGGYTGTESGQVMLRVQLDNAAAEFKAQAAEWQELLHMAKGEVSSLCRTVKNERESTTQKVVQQRNELDRMFESVQRTGSTPGVTAQPSRRNLGEDCAQVSGGLSASKVCDVITSMIWKLEESLTYKVGYIAGLFHSWRCEVFLMRAGGAWDKQRKIFEAQREKVMLQWYMGDQKGMLDMTLREWKKFTKESRQKESQREQVKMVCAKWMMGNAKALVTMGFRAWAEQAAAERHRRQLDGHRAEWERMHAQELAAKDALMEQKIKEWERRHANAKKDLYLVFAKWDKGKTKGLLEGTFKGWCQAIAAQKETAKRQAVFKEMMCQWFEGQAKGLLRSSLQAWFNYSKTNAGLRHERAKLEEFMNGEIARREQEAAERMSEEQRKKQAAKEAVALIVRKWEMGETKGLISEVFAVWSKYAMKWVQIRTSKADAQMAMAKFLEGDRRGILHTCWLHWKAEMQDVHAERVKQAELEDHKRQFGQFLDQQRGEWQMTAEQERKEAARKACQVLVAKWLLGNKRGLLTTAFSSWQEYTKKQAEADRQHEGIKMVVLRWAEGDRRALQEMCYVHWHKFASREAVHRVANALNEQVQDLESRLERHISHRKTKLLKYFAKLADGSAMLEVILAQWHKFSMGEKSAEMQRQLEMQLEEQERINKLEEAKKKEVALSALEYLGCKSSKSVLMKHYFAWVQFYEQARIDKDHKMQKNGMLTNLGEYMEGKWVTQSRKDLLTVCFQEWVRDMHQSALHLHLSEIETHRTVTYKLEQERAQLVEQLNLVYHQLDSVTETLQKELKTKEELAAELRDANEQMRKAQFSGTASGCYIDVQTIIKNSRAPSRATSPGSTYRDEVTIRRNDSDGSFPRTNTPRQNRKPASNSTVPTLPGGSGLSSSNYSSSTMRVMESPVVFGGARVSQDSPAINRSLRAASPGQGSQGSPNSCDWDHAISRMRDEGRFRAGEAPRF